MVRDDLTDIRQHLSLRGADHIHHVVFVAPLQGGLQHLFEKAVARLLVFRKLEIERTLVGGEGQQRDPLVFIGQERRD